MASSSRFPAEWGEPPKMQTRDYRQLPGGFGMGSSTLAGWIKKHIEEDAASGIVREGVSYAEVSLDGGSSPPAGRAPGGAFGPPRGFPGFGKPNLAAAAVAGSGPAAPRPAPAGEQEGAAAARTAIAFADAVGKDATAHREELKALHPQLNFVIVPEGGMMTMDVRHDRVRLFVDGQNKISKVPHTG